MSGINLRGETEQGLVEALQQGNQEVMGPLYDAYAPVMLGVILRIVPDKDQAEEVLQEAFVAIWSRVELFDPSNSRFLIWALAIARGVALEAAKSGKYKQAPPTQPDFQQQRALQGRPFCNLNPEECAALDLVYLKGRTCGQAAQELGMTEEKLRKTIKKAFIHLKAERTA